MFSWLKRLFSRSRSAQVLAYRNVGHPWKLEVEPLEERSLLALLGSEFPVNTQLAGTQANVATASSENGANVIVWVDNQVEQIKARLYDAAGAARGGEITLVTASANIAFTDPSVAMDSQGNFVVVWTRIPANLLTDIEFARFDADGTRLGTGVVANSANMETHPTVATDAAGNFVVSYRVFLSLTNGDIRAGMFQADGTAVQTLTVANSRKIEDFPRVARADDGAFAIAYALPARSGNTIRLVRYDATGQLLRTHNIAKKVGTPVIAMDDQGNTLVAWTGRVGTQLRQVSNTGVVGRVISFPNLVGLHAIAQDRTDGDFVIAHANNNQISVTEVSSAGVVRGTFDLGTRRTFEVGGWRDISIDGNGVYTVAYLYTDFPFPDGDGRAGVVARRGQL